MVEEDVVVIKPFSNLTIIRNPHCAGISPRRWSAW